MGSGAENIALNITASANVAEVAKARSEISALGDAAKKAGDENVAAWQAAATSVNVQIGAYERLGKVIDKTNLQAVAGYRALGTSLKDNLFQLEATESEINRIDVAMVRLERAAGAASLMVGESQAAAAAGTGGLAFSARRAQSAFVGAAFAMEAFSRSTDAGDGSLRRVLRSVSLLGFLGGPELGFVTTAISAVGDSMIDMWSRSEKAARKAQEQFQSTLETLARGSLASAAQARQALYSGDPFAALTGQRADESALAFLGRSGGQIALEREQARLRGLVAEANRQTLGGTTATTQQAVDRKAYIDQLREVNQLLATQDQRLAAIDGLMPSLLAKQKDLAKFELERMREAAARREAIRLRPEEVLMPITDLAEQMRSFGITGASREAALGDNRVRSIDLEFQRRQAAQRVDTEGLGRIRPAEIIETQFHLMQVTAAKSSEEFQKYLTTRVGNTMAEGLAAGIRAGFSGAGLKGAFAAGSRAILAGFGGMLIDEGRVYLEKAAIMQALVPHLFNPVTSGWAAAGIGAALIALGASLEGLATRGGGGSGGAAANGSAFVPSAANAGGGTTVNIYTANPYTREAALVAAYYINRGQTLNTPIPAPPGAPS